MVAVHSKNSIDGIGASGEQRTHEGNQDCSPFARPLRSPRGYMPTRKPPPVTPRKQKKTNTKVLVHNKDSVNDIGASGEQKQHDSEGNQDCSPFDRPLRSPRGYMPARGPPPVPPRKQKTT